MRVMTLLLLIMCSPLTGRFYSQTADPAAPSTDGWLVVPANTTVALQLRYTVNSRTAYVGQAIYCTTIYPVTVNNHIVIPVGSYVHGQITRVLKPGRVRGPAQIGLGFDAITLPDGTTQPLRAELSGFSTTGNEAYKHDQELIRGQTSRGADVAELAQSASQWAIVGGIAAGNSGRGGLGAGAGGTAGALIRLIAILVSRGKEIVLPLGTDLELSLREPLIYRTSPEQATTDGPEKTDPILAHRRRKPVTGDPYFSTKGPEASAGCH